MWEKFLDCGSRVFSQSRLSQLFETLMKFDEATNIAAVTGLLVKE